MIEVGAPTGKWQLIVVYRGKHCPVSRNYLASLQQIIYELDDLGVEVLALTADGREKAEAFVSLTHSRPAVLILHCVADYPCSVNGARMGTPLSLHGHTNGSTYTFCLCFACSVQQAASTLRNTAAYITFLLLCLYTMCS